MIYGYDEAQLFPVQSLYDTGMINMYLNAVKGEYERGIADLKEFISKYGDFISPFSKDVEAWDKATLGGYRDLINNLKQLGIDPIRSQEGRAAILNFILSRPYGDLSMLKQSAKTGFEYLKNMSDLAAKGLYNADMARDMYGDFDGWDTLKNGKTWNVSSPHRYDSIQSLLSPTIESLKKAYRKLRTENGEDVFGVTDDQVRGALNDSYVDLMNNPSMQYAFRKSGLNEEQFKNLLFKQVKDQTPEEYKENKIYMQDREFAFRASEGAKDRAATLQAAMMKNGVGPYANYSQFPNLTDKIEERTRSQVRGDNTKNNVDPAAFVNYFKNLAAGAKNAEHKKKYLQYMSEWKEYNKLSDDKKAEFLSKYGYLDQNNQLTEKYYRYLNNATGVFRGKNKVDAVTAVRNSEDFYNRNLVPVTGAENEVLVRNIPGLRKSPSGKYYQITFGNGNGVHYARQRALDYSGVKGFERTSNSNLYAQFDNWLNSNKISGNIFDRSGLMAGKLEGNALEISGMGVTVPFNRIKEFCDIARKRGYKTPTNMMLSNMTNEQIMSHLGLTIVTESGLPVSYSTTFDKDGNKKSSTQTKKETKYYVMIPTSKTLTGSGSYLSGLNEDYNMEMYGKKATYENAMSAIASSLQWTDQ